MAGTGFVQHVHDIDSDLTGLLRECRDVASFDFCH